MKLTVHPLTPERWADLETIFQAKGCSIARGCWCMYYRRSGKSPDLQPGETQSARNKLDLQALAASDQPPGLIGYEGKTPVGWISLGPREDFAKLKRSPVMGAVDDQPVWSIVCFVVPSEHRNRGVASALLTSAIAYAEKRGVTLLEAYPIDTSHPDAGESTWFGTQSMYDKAGFEEVARRKPASPVVRLALAAPNKR